MKRFLALFLAVMMIGCLLATTALADGVISPENGNTSVDTRPVSPQTGGLPASIVAVAAVALGGGALCFAKKSKD